MKTFQQSRRQNRVWRMVAIKPRVETAALRDALGYPVQAKLKVGAPDDVHEREADAVAERVMAAPEATVQRKCENCAQEDEQKKDAEQSEPEKQDEEIQRKETGGAATLTNNGAAAIAASRGGGQPLPTGERAFFEPRMGANLGPVRIHADAQAARLSADLAARAFTVGSDVYFGGGEYRPGEGEGRRLIAHELTHVLQQRGAEQQVQREAIELNSKRPDAGSSTGHAFVTMEDAGGARNGWGFYPAYTRCGNRLITDWEAIQIGVGVDVPGEVCGDLHHDYDQRVRYDIDTPTYTRTRQRADAALSSPPDYDFLSYNCVDFVRTIAAVAGVPVPDFPGVDEPTELADHIRDARDKQIIDSGVLSLAGASEVDLTQPEPTFSVSGLPTGHHLRFRWVITDAADNRYLMWGRGGSVFRYGRQSSAYIGSQTRAMLMERDIRSATILCRAIAAEGRSLETDVQLRLPVTFTW
jgi:hypothetical protein